MRAPALLLLSLSLVVTSALAQRKDVSPLAKSPDTVAPCLATCESEFKGCEAVEQATPTLCPESRRLCYERCDPAVLATETYRGLKRTPEELRAKAPMPRSAEESCKQTCQDRRSICLSVNAATVCDPAIEACYGRCGVALEREPALKPKAP